jgi:hypothetical protein
MARSHEIIKHLIDLSIDEYALESPGICTSCPRYADNHRWVDSCDDCIFYSAHNRELVSESLKILKTLTLIED